MDLLKPEQYRIEYWANELARNEGARKAAFEFFSKDAIKVIDAREQARILYIILAEGTVKILSQIDLAVLGPVLF